MRKYRLFMMKKEIVSIYKKNPMVLYKTLKVLFYQKDNLQIGVSLYHQLCDPFAVLLLCNYISEKIPSTKIENQKYHLLSFYENTFVHIRSSHIVIKTDQEKSAIFRIFNIYNRFIFVVDFEHDTYFWLNEYISKHFS